LLLRLGLCLLPLQMLQGCLHDAEVAGVVLVLQMPIGCELTQRLIHQHIHDWISQ
jgi:hypothetical protein